MELCLIIEDLTLDTIIGILPHERIQAQKLHLNAKIFYDYHQEFLDYTHIIEFITNDIHRHKYELLEDLLLNLTKNLKDTFVNITSLYLEVKKPEILKDCIPGASIKRSFV
ncbi:MAG: dihydroneopterin aldolase [Helicobacter sp.]|nr:dihydroneopterin aldolase [Helicobacter sp.]